MYKILMTPVLDFFSSHPVIALLVALIVIGIFLGRHFYAIYLLWVNSKFIRSKMPSKLSSITSHNSLLTRVIKQIQDESTFKKLYGKDFCHKKMKMILKCHDLGIFTLAEMRACLHYFTFKENKLTIEVDKYTVDVWLALAMAFAITISLLLSSLYIMYITYSNRSWLLFLLGLLMFFIWVGYGWWVMAPFRDFHTAKRCKVLLEEFEEENQCVSQLDFTKAY